MFLQGKYIFGDYSSVFFVADPYNGGTTFLNNWQWLTVNLYEKTSAGVVAYSPVELYSFGIDRSNEMYGLTDIGIFRITNSSKCGFTC